MRRPTLHVLTDERGRKLCAGSLDKCHKVWQAQYVGRTPVKCWRVKNGQAEIAWMSLKLHHNQDML